MIAACLIAAMLTMGSPPDAVRDCPKGLVCFTVDEAADIDVRLIELERDLKVARAKTKRFGLTAGCGPGVAARVLDGEATLDSAIVCGVVWGPRL